jgi:hypothetical protein
MIATVMRAIIAMQLRGVNNPRINPTPARISTVPAINACCLGNFIPILENQDAVPEMLFALLIPWYAIDAPREMRSIASAVSILFTLEL